MLIDTHILVWSFEGTPGSMGRQTVELIKKEFGNCFISMASLFEIKIKQRKGGLSRFSIINLEAKARAEGANILDIQLNHLAEIPDYDITRHADPFDILLMAQAVSEGLPLLTCDKQILEISLPGLRLIDGRK